MGSKLFMLFVLCMATSGFAQQNEEFRTTKGFFDYQRMMLQQEFTKQLAKEKKSANKAAANRDFAEFMIKLDSIQNRAFINTLIKVKNREDLDRIQTRNLSELALKNPVKEKLNAEAHYPGGFDKLKSQVAELFYNDAVLPDQKLLKTDVVFVVEENGQISNVNAQGENFTFNRQAEIAMYLLPEKFTPAIINGEPVSYRFRLPLTMRFD